LPLRFIYIPGLHQYLLDIEQPVVVGALDAGAEAESFHLSLPSFFPDNRRRAACNEGLPEIEGRLRLAQCHDALRGLLHNLRVKSRMMHFKKNNIRGQRDGVQSRMVINRVHERTRKYASKYRECRARLLLLQGHGDWELQLQVLEDGDIRSYTDPRLLVAGPGRRGTVEENAEPQVTPQIPENTVDNIFDNDNERTQRDGTGETRRELSWIWRTSKLDISDSTDANDDILRSEWAKSRARARRGTEQVQKTREEMRRTLAFLKCIRKTGLAINSPKL